jgi:hypothetical protein
MVPLAASTRTARCLTWCWMQLQVAILLGDLKGHTCCVQAEHLEVGSQQELRLPLRGFGVSVSPCRHQDLCKTLARVHVALQENNSVSNLPYWRCRTPALLIQRWGTHHNERHPFGHDDRDVICQMALHDDLHNRGELVPQDCVAVVCTPEPGQPREDMEARVPVCREMPVGIRSFEKVLKSQPCECLIDVSLSKMRCHLHTFRIRYIWLRYHWRPNTKDDWHARTLSDNKIVSSCPVRFRQASRMAVTSWPGDFEVEGSQCNAFCKHTTSKSLQDSLLLRDMVW